MAVDESFGVYLEYTKAEEPTDDSWAKGFTKIPAVAAMQRQMVEKPYLRRLFYIQGIIRKRSGAKRYECVEYLEHLHICGADLNDMEARAKKLRKIEDFEGPYDAWLGEIGRSY